MKRGGGNERQWGSYCLIKVTIKYRRRNGRLGGNKKKKGAGEVVGRERAFKLKGEGRERGC